MAQTKRKRFYSEDEQTVEAVRSRFLQVNNDRLSTVRDTLKTKQKQFLDILPLLFHYNEPKLPGFVGEECPIGIYDYTPNKKSTEAAQSLAKSYSDRRNPLRQYHLYALYLIGSAGTIAYTDRSDLDIWVCHRSDLTDEQIDALQSKCDKLSEWAESLALEANFFVLTPESIREGRIETLSDESSGSAQHQLLIEEFYRSGLLLSGRIPAWWLVPPDKEHTYYQHLEMLLSKKIIQEHDIIDFGDVHSISAAEFYGAALWQLNKAITSPYKSILKLLLMESYASEYPKTDLLCTRLKRAIYEGETNIDKLDSYVLMINKLDSYLSKQESMHGRLHLARRCFYFKVHEWLTDNTGQKQGRAFDIMSELTTAWSWTRDDLLLLDSRETWKIDRVLEERKILVDELTLSYRMLTDMARQHTQETNISQEDLNILGRRLYTTFERKAGKIDLINPGISVNLSEDKLAFVYTQINDIPTWLLYRQDYETAKTQKIAPIKRTQNLIELVAWCHFNGIIGNNTLITLHNQIKGISSEDLLKLIDTFKFHFPDGRIPKASIQQLSDSAYISDSAVFINVGYDPLLSHTQRGLHLTSNRSDALSFGGRWQNLIKTCSSIVITSWGEILTNQYDGNNCVLECITDQLSWTPVSAQQQPTNIKSYCFAASYSTSISRRITKLFEDLVLYFYKNKWGKHARYILRIERHYALIQVENDTPRYEIVSNESELIKALGSPQEQFSPYLFDRHTTDNNVLKILQRFNKPNTIQLFYYDRKGEADIYVLDEFGSLHTQTIEYYDIPTMLGHFKNFFDAAIKRHHMRLSTELTTDNSLNYVFHPVQKSLNGSLHIELNNQPKVSSKLNYFDIQVIGDIFNIQNDTFYLYCNGKEFTNLEFGNNVLNEAVAYILSQRRLGERYPIYITDIDINQSHLLSEQPMQTVQLLCYKKKIEEKLNQTLKQL